MSRSEKNAQPLKINLIAGVIVVLFGILLFMFMPGMSDFWTRNTQSKILVISILVFAFVSSLWKYSKPWMRLRDKMVDSVSGSDAGTDKRSWLLVMIWVLVGLMIGCIYYASQI